MKKFAVVLLLMSALPLFATAQADESAMPDMPFVRVEGGTFTMGSDGGERDEKPPHQVTVSTFFIGKYEVTQAQWESVMGTNPSRFKGDNLPVETVNMAEIYRFIARLGENTGRVYRLPTEAEWEYAARGGNKSQGYKFSGGNSIQDVAWARGNGRTTHPVGTKQPNELNIYDMSGNVSEWCSDWYGRYSEEAQVNPSGPPSGSFVVCRGGSWNHEPEECTVSFRQTANPDRSFTLGFRLVLVR